MRLGSSGDIVMTSPLLRALRRAYPDGFITFIAEHTHLEAIDANPIVDEVVRWDSSYFYKPLRKHRYLQWVWRVLEFAPQLRQRRFDIFICFDPEDWRLMPRGARAPVSIGVFDTWRSLHEDNATSPNTRYYTKAFTWQDLPEHRSQAALLPLQPLNLPPPADLRMTIGFTAEDAAAIGRFLADAGLAERQPYVVVAPMTTWESRCWPLDRYAQLCDHIHALRPATRVVLIGSAKERDAVLRVAEEMATPPVVAAGAFGFRQMAALIAGADLVVSGDTGPMHVAAAVGTPYVALFGPTPPAGRAPLQGPGLTIVHPVPCGPCDREHCGNPPETFKLCMNLISVDEAFDAVSHCVRSRTAVVP
jgi:ADP-heptose:LPS heptosyltransferase